MDELEDILHTYTPNRVWRAYNTFDAVDTKATSKNLLLIALQCLSCIKKVTNMGVFAYYRVAARHHCLEAPSERYVKVSNHTAQAFQTLVAERGFTTDNPCV